MKSHHILIVEDEAITRTKLAGYFESEGYRVTAVGSAKEMRLVLSQEDVACSCWILTCLMKVVYC